MFLLIDGSSLLTTNFMGNLPPEIKFSKDDDKYEKYADKILQTSGGIYTNGVYSTLMDIMRIIRIHKPQYIAVAFDKTRDTFRRKIYPLYKAQRKEKPYALQQQFDTLKSILNSLGILILESDKYEADDLIGSAATFFNNPFQKIKILTKDHDYLQLKNDFVDIWMMQTSADIEDRLRIKYSLEPKVEEWQYLAAKDSYSEDSCLPCKAVNFTEDIIKGEHGVLSDMIIDLKGLIGDSSDNIPGARGIGPKVAVPLLSKYGSIENIYTAIDACENNAKKEKELSLTWKEELDIKKSPINKLKENREMVYTSRFLATIQTDLRIPTNLDMYRCNINYNIYNDICKRYEFATLMESA